MTPMSAGAVPPASSCCTTRAVASASVRFIFDEPSLLSLPPCTGTSATGQSGRGHAKPGTAGLSQ